MARRRQICDELAEVERAKARERELQARLAAVDDALAPAILPSLHALPRTHCAVAWSDMEGNDARRRCPRCQHDVFDLRSMEAASAEHLLARSASAHRRADDRVALAPCPAPFRLRPFPLRPGLFALAVASMAAVFLLQQTLPARRFRARPSPTPSVSAAPATSLPVAVRASAPPLVRSRPGPSVRRVGVTTWEVDVDRWIAGWPTGSPSSFLRPYRGRPGRGGVEVASPSGVLSELGFREGDVIRSLNSRPLKSVDDVFVAYRRLRRAQVVFVEVERASQRRLHVYRLRHGTSD